MILIRKPIKQEVYDGTFIRPRMAIHYVMALFIGRHHVDDEYEPDIYRSKDDDWEL